MRSQPATPPPPAAEELSPTMILLQSLSQVNPQLLIGVVTLGMMFIGALVLNVFMCAMLVLRQKKTPQQPPQQPPIQYIVQGTPQTTPMVASPNTNRTVSKARSEAGDSESAPSPAVKSAKPVGPGAAGMRRSASRAAFDSEMTFTPKTADGKMLLTSQVPTMKEAVELHESRNNYIKNKTPQELLQDLKAGNTRFWTGVADRPDFSPAERRALIKGQVPKVAVLGCADSRVPIEIVLDQGLGDVFVTRNAGNLYGDKVGGTIDYAVHHLGIKLVVIMGHQGCGAVKAARLPRSAINKESPRLREMLNDMKDSLEYCSETLDNIQDPNARDREAVIANAQAQVKKLSEDPQIAKKIKAGELIVIAAFYEITSGIVDFIE